MGILLTASYSGSALLTINPEIRTAARLFLVWAALMIFLVARGLTLGARFPALERAVFRAPGANIRAA